MITAAAPVRAATEAPLVVETISSGAALDALEVEWDDLVAAAGVDHPFFSHAWIRAWWSAFGLRRTLCLIAVRRAGRLVALAPLMLGRARLCGVPVALLELAANDHTPRGGFVVAPDCPGAHEAIWDAARALPWDALMLRQLPEGSPTLQAFAERARHDGLPTGVWRSEGSPYLPIDGPWEEYFRSLGAKHRSNLRNRMKRLRAFGPVATEKFTSCDSLDAALADGFRIEAAAWKGRAGTAIASHPETTLFYTSLARGAARRGALRLRFLTVAGQRVACEYSLRWRAREFLLKPGYDPRFAPLAPHILLCAETLRELFAEKLIEYDFLGAADRWKTEWTGRTRPHVWLYAFAPTLRGRLAYRLKFQVAPRMRRRS